MQFCKNEPDQIAVEPTFVISVLGTNYPYSCYYWPMASGPIYYERNCKNKQPDQMVL